MSIELYLYLRLILASILLVFGIGLTFGIIPKKLRNTIFDSSRRTMGIAIMIIPITTITSASFNSREAGGLTNDLETLIYLTSVYTITAFTSISYISLLGNHVKLKYMRLARSIFGCILYPIPLIAAILYGNNTVINIITTVTSVHLFAIIFYECVTFYMLYINGIKRVNNYYSDDIGVNITWLHNSALFILSMALVTGIVIFIPNLPVWANFLITIYRCFVFGYAFYSFIRFVKSFANMESSTSHNNPLVEFEHELNRVSSETECNISLDNNVRSEIIKKIDEWIEAMNYTHRNITLQSLAQDISIDRSLVSSFIHSTYKCSFKSWIIGLRVKHAKELLVNNSELSISAIAITVGFSSTNSFTHAFKQIESIAPNKWRADNSHHVDNNEKN